MPSKGTPKRAIRIPEELWRAALVKADGRGESVAGVIRAALEVYVSDDVAYPPGPGVDLDSGS